VPVKCIDSSCGVHPASFSRGSDDNLNIFMISFLCKQELELKILIDYNLFCGKETDVQHFVRLKTKVNISNNQ
jgi:hypothetical protein